jgi:hypothetical protein
MMTNLPTEDRLLARRRLLRAAGAAGLVAPFGLLGSRGGAEADPLAQAPICSPVIQVADAPVLARRPRGRRPLARCCGTGAFLAGCR